jgi:hypothetical protein
MDRRDFLKKGTALAALTTSINNILVYEPRQEAYAATAPDTAPDHESGSSLVTDDEMRTARQWYTAVCADGPNYSRTGEWLEEWIGTAIPFSFHYGGESSRSLLAKWQFHREDGQSNAFSDQTKLVWKDPASGLQVSWHVKRFTDFPAIEWTLWFENVGDQNTLLLEDIQDLDLCLNASTNNDPSMNNRPFILHGARGGRYKRDDWGPFSQYIPAAVAKWPPNYENANEAELGGDYPSSRRNLPFFNLESSESRGAVVGIGWTGNWAGHLEVDKNHLTARVGLKETRFVLHPGEEVRTARILVLLWKGKSLHGQNMLRRLLYEHYIPRIDGKPQEPLVSMNSGFTHHGNGDFLEQGNEKSLLPEVQPFLRLGGEAFIIDAGWYEGKTWQEGMGNWTYSRVKYPNGFRSIAAPLEAAQAKFGIWFAPELVNKDKPLQREHPEWVRDNELRLELPEAREWFLNQVGELIEKQGMTLYRQDGSNSESVLREGEPDNRKGVREIQYMMGLYAMEDELRKRHPQLIMEAAVGAPRIDLETISRFHWHQPCETFGHPALDQCQTYGIGLWMPGGFLVFFNGSLDNYGLWSGFGGQLCVAWEPSDPDFPTVWASHQIGLYKRIRHFLCGDFYPLTPISLESTWMGYQYHRIDLKSGCALIFKRVKSAQVIYSESDTFKLQLNGLAPGSRYQVHFESNNKDMILTDRELAKGVELTLGTAPTAELVVYQAIT